MGRRPGAQSSPALNHLARRRSRAAAHPPLPPPTPQPKLTSVQLWKFNGPDKDPFLLGLASDLSTFGFFQRGTVGEMLTFTGRTIARRTQVHDCVVRLLPAFQQSLNLRLLAAQRGRAAGGVGCCRAWGWRRACCCWSLLLLEFVAAAQRTAPPSSAGVA